MRISSIPNSIRPPISFVLEPDSGSSFRSTLILGRHLQRPPDFLVQHSIVDVDVSSYPLFFQFNPFVYLRFLFLLTLPCIINGNKEGRRRGEEGAFLGRGVRVCEGGM